LGRAIAKPFDCRSGTAQHKYLVLLGFVASTQPTIESTHLVFSQNKMRFYLFSERGFSQIVDWFYNMKSEK